MRKILLSLVLSLSASPMLLASVPTFMGQGKESVDPSSQLTEITFSRSDEIVVPPRPKAEASWSKTVPSMNNIAGKYLDERYYPSTQLAGMYMLTVEAGTGNNITIANLLGYGKTINATVDFTNKTVTIPAGQIIGELPDGSRLTACYVDLDRSTYYPNVDITGTISNSGVITIGSWIAVASGPTTGQIVTHHDKNYRLNATATHTSIYSGENQVYSHPIHVSMSSTTQMLIKNLWNTGYGTEATLDSLGNLTITRKIIAYGQNSLGTAVALYNNKVTKIDDTTTPPTYTMSTASTLAKWEGSTINVEPWAIANSTTPTTAVVGDVIRNTVISGVDEFVPFTSALTLRGSGTEADPYIIATKEDLMNLSLVTNYNSKYVASGYTMRGKYFSQTADIDMKDIENFEPIAMLSSRYFGGIYNGNGHKISNLTVNQTKGTTVYAGLFGNVRDGEIKNLILENPVISSTSANSGAVVGYLTGKVTDVTVNGLQMDIPGAMYAGGAVGQAVAPGKIENVRTSGVMNVYDYAGGIVGNGPGVKVYNCVSDMHIIRSTSTASTPYFGGIIGAAVRDTMQIRNCAFYGNITVSGNEIAGGIIGRLEKGMVEGCHFGGTIMHNYTSSSTAQIGGVVGYMKDARVFDCNNTGIVQSYTTLTVGGVAGVAEQSVTTTGTELKRNLYTGTLMVSNAVRKNEIVASCKGNVVEENNYFDAQTAYNYGKGNTTASLTGATLPTGLSTTYWVAQEGYYPVLSRFANENKAKLDRVPFFLSNGDNIKAIKNNFTLGQADGVRWYLFHNNSYSTTGNALTINGTNVAVNTSATIGDTIVALYGDALFRMIPVVVEGKDFDGNGTESDPYLIKSKADMDRLFNTVDVVLKDYTGTYFRLANDIDMSGTASDFRGYSKNGVTYAFNGIFDGAGYSIKNLVVNDVTSQTAAGSLFNYVGVDAIIKNLVIDSSCSFRAGTYAGAVAGYNAGKILNCRNHANVTALYRYAGGIAGANADSIGGCYNDGRVITDQYYAGGIAGANAGSISECQNSGYVSAELSKGFNEKDSECLYAGGITGLNQGHVTNSLNQGYINGYGVVGGIVGDHAAANTYDLSGNINTGVVASESNPLTIGAISGRKSTSNSAKVVGNLYDKQMGHNAAVNNTSLEGNVALTTKALVGGTAPEGFNSELWQWEAGKYPVLKAFANEGSSKFLSEARVEFAVSPREESRFDKRGDAEVKLPEGATASLKEGKVFQLNNGILSHSSSSEALQDTLVISKSNYKLTVPLFASPKLLPNGDGSAQNPWVISTPEEWNVVAMYAEEYRATFEGDNFIVSKDLDFSKTGFVPICQDGTTYFEGNFNGNGKTLSGIVVKDENSSTGSRLGVFGMAGSNAEIYDLTLAENDTIAGYQYVGGLVGYCSGKVHGIVNKASVSTLKMTAAGGVVGYGTSSAEVYGCVNYGTVSSFSTAGGGIMGTNDPGAKVYDCKNYGYITSKGSTGGILGSTKSSVRNSQNYGEIYSSAGNAGGIVGYMWPTYTTDNEISGCDNYGAVKAATSAAGGMTGILNTPANIINCNNYGDITTITTFAGGILGSMAAKICKINNCVNYGRVIATTNTAGGIVGTTATLNNKDAFSEISDVANYGNVRALGAATAGGITGVGQYYLTITRAYNYCDSVTAKTTGVGGIIGSGCGQLSDVYNRAYIEGTSQLGGIIGNSLTVGTYGQYITNAVNIGELHTTGTTATTGYRIGGIQGYGWINVSNAVNAGDIKGVTSVAGIIGHPYNTTSVQGKIENSYNVGRIVATDAANQSKCGMILGTAVPANYAINNCYYDNQMAGLTLATCDAEVAGVKGVATRQLMEANLGEGFVVMPKSYPRLVNMKDSAVMQLASAPLVLADGENADRVSQHFYAYCVDGAWSGEGISLNRHSEAWWDGVSTDAPTRLTAKVGRYERPVNLQFSVSSGVEAFTNEYGELKSVKYFRIDGTEVDAIPAEGIYVRISEYSNGTIKTEKIVIKE